jgi:dCTP deaminase
VPICQIFFHEVAGAITEYSSDKYQHNRDIQPSLLFREIGQGDDRGQQLQLDFAAEASAARELVAARPAK